MPLTEQLEGADARTRIGLWGVFGNGNYGNEATLSACLAHLDSGSFRPVILTDTPAEAARLHHTPAKLIGAPVFGGSGPRWIQRARGLGNRLSYVMGALRTARTLDAIVVVGSGGLERTGPFGTPFEIWSLALGCRVFKRTFALLNVGVDEPQQAMTRFFTRTAGQWARYRSYRDELSRENMMRTGLRLAATDPVVTDLTFDHRPPRSSERDAQRIAIGVMAYRGADDSDVAAYRDYLSRSVELIGSLVDRDFTVTLVAGDDIDRVAARKLAARFPSNQVDVSLARTPEELTLTLSLASVVIATRYHTLIFALIAGTPVVSIGYGPKHRAMLKQLDLPDNHSDSSLFIPGSVADGAVALSSDAAVMTPRIDAAIDAARRRLADEWPRALAELTSR